MQEILQRLNVSSQAPKLLCIDGPAGAGKTELSAVVAEQFTDSFVVHMDDLYDGWDDSLGEALTTRLKTSIIEPFTSRQPLILQKYNWHLGEFGSPESIAIPSLLIVEGVGAAQEAMRKVASVTVFIEVDDETGKNRVLDRDGEYMIDHIDAWQQQQTEHHKKHRTRESCDLVLGATWWKN